MLVCKQGEWCSTTFLGVYKTEVACLQEKALYKNKKELSCIPVKTKLIQVKQGSEHEQINN